MTTESNRSFNFKPSYSSASSSMSSDRSTPPFMAPPSSIETASTTSQRITYSAQIPPHLRHIEGHFQNGRRQNLFYFALFPEPGRAVRGIVLHLHGLGDHCRRYIFVYERLCAAGFGVVTFDFVNHGSSDTDDRFNHLPSTMMPRGHIHKFQHLVDDANTFVTFAKTQILPLVRYKAGSYVSTLVNAQWVCMGISFGSLVATHVVLSGKHAFRGGVFNSPTIAARRTTERFVKAMILRPISVFAPTARVVPTIDYEWICRDPHFVENFANDPLTSTEMMTARTGVQIMKGMKALRKNSKIQDPSSAFCCTSMLFMGGSLDNIADMPSAVELFDRMANKDKEFKLFKGMFHCVYEDPESDVVFEYLADWLQQRCPSS